MKSAAKSADINAVVVKNGHAAAVAGHTEFKVIVCRACGLSVKNGFCEKPCCAVAVDFHVNDVGIKFSFAYAALAVKLYKAVLCADKHMVVVIAKKHIYMRFVAYVNMYELITLKA